MGREKCEVREREGEEKGIRKGRRRNEKGGDREREEK